ncbi:hypothetical protein Tco_1397236, partial [Tanacetum coccineum]
IIGQLLVDHALSYALIATANDPVVVDMFRATLKLPVETLKQPFIPPASLEYIQPCLKIVGYQGLVDNYPCFTKLIISDIMAKYESITKRLEEDYRSIKDDTLFVNVYTTRKVIVKGMMIPNDLLTDVIRDTQAYKDYEEKYGGVECHTPPRRKNKA